ncbi:MAG: MMPL family transporter [Deltaproteobacteria bacterium]|nr:MMPL family transporter [Deltaproteobacteria bacterium]
MLLALPDQEQSQSHRVHPALFKTTDKLIHWNQNHSNLILLFFLLLTLGFGLGLKDLHVETKPISYYKKGSAIRNAFEYFDANFRGSTTIDILLNGPAGAFKDPQNLKAVEKILNEYQKDDRVSPPLTAIDYLKRANQALHDGDLAFFKIPESQEEIAQVYLFLEGEEAFSDVLRDEYSELRLTSRIQALGSRVGSQIMMRLEKILNQNLPKGISFTVTGTNVVWANMENYIADSLTRSFVGTIILVTIMMMLVLKSWKWGLISMIPNLVPIVMVFGLMGWVGIPLNMITLMIASIAIGIAVDDTIHLTIHIRKKTTEGMGLDDAIVSAFHHIGLAVISTSVILALGFLTMVISSFIPTQQFGFYTALTVVFALLCDLLLLPAVLKLFQRVL